MKNIIIIFLAVFMLGNTTAVNAQSKKIDAFTVQVDGLGCPFCAYGLEKKFKELKGIKNVKIEMETGVMNFDYPADKGLSIAQVEKQVEKAGYTPVTVDIVRSDGRVETTKVEQVTDSENKEVKQLAFYVAGNCGMCQARIEKAAKSVPGVLGAEWNKDTKQVSLSLGAGVDQSAVEKAIAASGHDTKTAKADNTVYEELPGCCQYDRAQ